jgi:hypothetical protein
MNPQPQRTFPAYSRATIMEAIWDFLGFLGIVWHTILVMICVTGYDHAFCIWFLSCHGPVSEFSAVVARPLESGTGTTVSLLLLTALIHRVDLHGDWLVLNSVCHMKCAPSHCEHCRQGGRVCSDDGAVDVIAETPLEHMNPFQVRHILSLGRDPDEALLLILKFCMDNQVTMTALEHLLPQPNRIPRSKYKLFQLLGIDVERYERHVCDKDCDFYPILDPSEYELHHNQTCPECQRPRFRRQGATLSPVKKFYVILVQHQIALLKRNPEFDQCAARMWAEVEVSETNFYHTFLERITCRASLGANGWGCERLHPHSYLLSRFGWGSGVWSW